MSDQYQVYWVEEWAIPAITEGDFSGYIPDENPDSCGEREATYQFIEEFLHGGEKRVIIDPSYIVETRKGEVTGTVADCVRIFVK